MIRAILVLTGSVCCVLAVGGCQRRGPIPRSHMASPVERPGVNYHFHKVKYPGETLSVISDWYTGTPAHWREISEVNPGLSFGKLRVGDSVRVPRFLMVREGPLPRSMIEAKIKRVERPVVAAPTQDQPMHTREAPIEPAPAAAAAASVSKPVAEAKPASLTQVDKSAGVELPTISEATEPTPAPKKTRDELLRELLADQ